MLIDPYKKEMATYLPVGAPADWRVLQREDEKLIGKKATGGSPQVMGTLPASNAATPEHKSYPDAVARRRKEPHVVMVAHRGTEEIIRQFDINPASPSGLSLAEELFKGAWRLLSLDEEQAELERRAALKKTEIFRNEQELRAKELAVAERALQFATSLQPKKDAK